MKLNFARYITCVALCIAPLKLYAYDSEIRVYDIKNHMLIGSYQRIGTINGYESGIVKKPNQPPVNVIEKPAQTYPLNQPSPDIVGYIKFKSFSQESRNLSKRSYLYLAEIPDNRAETEILKKKHNHLMP